MRNRDEKTTTVKRRKLEYEMEAEQLKGGLREFKKQDLENSKRMVKLEEIIEHKTRECGEQVWIPAASAHKLYRNKMASAEKQR